MTPLRNNALALPAAGGRRLIGPDVPERRRLIGPDEPERRRTATQATKLLCSALAGS